MRRGMLTLTALGLLGLILGCHTHGNCDCNTHPTGYGTFAGHPEGPMPPPANLTAPTTAPIMK